MLKRVSRIGTLTAIEPTNLPFNAMEIWGCDTSTKLTKFIGTLMAISIVIKPKLNVDPVYELGHWFNQWVIGRTIRSNKIKKIKYI